MRESLPRRSIVSSACLATSVLCCATVSAQTRPPQQDSTLDNLRHVAGYRTAPLGTLAPPLRGGTGPVDVVLIPGWGFGASVFDVFMRENASQLRMVAVTLPGFGGTPAPPMPPAGTSYGDATWIRAAAEGVAQLIRRERLTKPVVLAHFIVSPQVALRLALEHPGLVGGLVLVGAEPMRFLPSRRDSTGKTPMSREDRIVGADTYMAPRWFKTVTKQTFDASNFTPEQYASESERASQRWKEAARVPIPVMIRYLMEFGTMDLTDEWARVLVPMQVLAPTFTPAMLADSAQAWLKSSYVEGWDSFARANHRIRITQVPGSRIFVTDDNPAAVRKALVDVAALRR
jgi:pimeloyl-ACP methyl ester carboxylesterase